MRLGGTGLEVSELCLGLWMFGLERDGREVVDRAQTRALLDAAYERGLTFFDTANVYGMGRSEQYLGEWLAGKDRESVVIASKVFFTTRGPLKAGLSRKIVRAEIDASLERLRTDYLDIYYIHGWLPTSPIEETLSAMNDLVRAGKVHYVGVSNFAAWQLIEARRICERNGWELPWIIQPRYNAVDHVPHTVDPAVMALPDLFDACRDQQVAVCPYSPLAGGFLTGKYRRAEEAPVGSRATIMEGYGGFPDRWWRVLDAVCEVAEEVGSTPGRVALRWAMMVPGLTSVPIVGVTSRAQLDENLGALEVTLTDEQWSKIHTAGARAEDNAYGY